MATTKLDELKALERNVERHQQDLEIHRNAYNKMTAAERIIDAFHGLVCHSAYAAHYRDCNHTPSGAFKYHKEENIKVVQEHILNAGMNEGLVLELFNALIRLKF